MGRRNIAFFLPSEGGPRLGGSNYEVRIYTTASKASVTAATLYADDTTGTTLTQPLKPNGGPQTYITTGGGAAAVWNVNDTSGFQIGDEVPVRSVSVQEFRTIITLSANQITFSQATVNGFATNDTIGDVMMKGWVNCWVDDTGDYTVEIKNVSTGKVMPRASLPLKAPNSNPCVRAYHSTFQTLTTGVLTTLNLDSERFDTDTIHDLVTNNSRLTCKTAGKYQITGNMGFVLNATGFRYVRILLNGATEIARVVSTPNGGAECDVNITTLYALAVNDYVELSAQQNSGGNLNTIAQANALTEFGMVKVSD